MELQEELIIYEGKRGKEFTDFIRKLLLKGRLKDKYINLLMSKDSMDVYNYAFTSDTADPINNYQIYEQLGDLSANKFIVSYAYNRFPQLRCSKAVKIVARLRINYGSKQTFSKIADELGFWDFITASEDQRSNKKKPLLEDTLEAFIGATEYLIDTKVMNCVGYAIVYDILASIFDEIDISLKYRDLYDSKTRLKELFDLFGKDALGTLEYKVTKDEVTKINTAIVYQKIGARFEKELGRGTAALKNSSEQAAAAMGIETMRRMGYEKKTPRIYVELCGDRD